MYGGGVVDGVGWNLFVWFVCLFGVFWIGDYLRFVLGFFRVFYVKVDAV